MSMQQKIEQHLHVALAPTHLTVINQSDMHNVPPASETHFKVIVISTTFTGQSHVQRHRLVHGLVHDLWRAQIGDGPAHPSETSAPATPATSSQVTSSTSSPATSGASNTTPKLHALAITALTPEEWQARGQHAPPSPPCLGGDKRDAMAS